MYVTFLASLEYNNTCYPGMLYQEPRWEQGLFVILYESFYDGQDCWNEIKLCHMLNTHRVFLLYVICGEFLAHPTGKKTWHMRDKQRACLLCVF